MLVAEYDEWGGVGTHALLWHSEHGMATARRQPQPAAFVFRVQCALCTMYEPNCEP